MRYSYAILLAGLLVLTNTNTAWAQQDRPSEADLILNEPLSTPALLNTDQRITEIFSAAVKGGLFSGKEGSFTFETSLFGLGKIFSSDWNLDTEYLKRRLLRRIEVSTEFVFDEADKLQSFRPSVKLALVNRRERTEHNFYRDFILDHNSIATGLADATQQALDAGGAERIEELDKTAEKFEETGKLADLHPAIRKALPTTLTQDKLDQLQERYEEHAREVDRGLLFTLTVGGESSRSDHRDSLFAEASLYKGFQTAGSIVLDLELKSRLALKDTSMTEADFSRVQWLNSAGLDAILVKDDTGKALVEGSMALEYNRILKGHLEDEKRDVFNLAFTLSPVVSDDFALPITLKWDPEDGDIFAVFSLLWKFSPIGDK